MQVVAVPVKALPRSKGRLAPLLTPSERAALTLALLDDVLAACTGQAGWETWVVSPDPDVLEAAAVCGAEPVRDEQGSLLGAVRQLERRAAGSLDALAIVLGDLPDLTRGDVRVALAPTAPVVLAPAASDGGTNFLLRRPSEAIPARFGRRSFARHRWEAARRGLELAEIRTPGLAHDLDRPADLARLIGSEHPSLTRSVCLQMGLAERLPLLDRLAGA
jgi:2-phospho-L-lactate guanylyltransferase